ncbi:hypothetical protein KY363_07655 [Candidatus Woesearchaeota archaeon]|nr:hypothetical protein [Candidatus Woesearchaeota archaeon]
MGRRINRYLTEKELLEREHRRAYDNHDHEDSDRLSPTLRTIRNTALAICGGAILSVYVFVGLNHSYNRRHPLDNYPPCAYTTQKGDTLTGICQSEGFSGDDLQGCIDNVCGENFYNRMPDGITPIFDPLDPSCSTMRAGGRINVPNKDRDGTVNGQQCQ